MNIAVFGTGVVGQTLSDRLSESGQNIMIGTRSVKDTMARTEPDGYGNPAFPLWLKDHDGVKLGSFAEAAAYGDILINATRGTESMKVLEMAGAQNMAGKILIDIANPLDFSRGTPPSLFISNTNSLAEEIQKAYPGLRVVKTLNTLNTALMARPQLLADGDHSIFMSGNDEDAKAEVKSLLDTWFGWKNERIFDLGDITTARGTEMLLPVWVRLYSSLQTPMFNFKIVREQ